MNKDSAYKENHRLKKELADTRAELARIKKNFGISDEENPDCLWTEMRSGYWEWNGNSEMPLVSSAFQKMLGYSDQKLKKDFWRAHIFTSDLAKMYEVFEKHMQSKGKIPFDVTLRFRHKKGHTVHIWGRGRIVDWNKDGNPERLVGSVIDITDIVMQRAASKDISERLQLIVAGSDAAVWDWKLCQDEIWWSENHYELLGYKPGEVTPTFDLFNRHLHPDDAAALKRKLEEHFNERKPFRIELRLTRKDGRMIWVESTGQAIFNNEGNPERFAGGLLDISARKDLEIQLRNQNMVLRQAEEMAKLGGWEIDLETGKISMTDEVYRIREIPEDAEFTMESLTKNDPPESQRIMRESIEKGRSGEPYEHEIEIQTYNGKRIWVHSKGEPVRNEEGKVIAIRGVLQNVDEYKRKEFELKNIRQKLHDQVSLLKVAEEVAQMGSWYYDIVSGKVIWSESIYKIRGLPGDFDPNLHSVLESYVGESREKLKRAIKAAVEEGKDYEFDLQMNRYSGEVIWVKVKGVAVKIDGKIAALRGILQNIDQYKKQEEELKETEQLYSEAARIGKVGAWKLNVNTKELTWSREIYNILAFPYSFQPTLENGLNLYNSEDKERLEEAIHNSVEKGTSFSLELQLTTADNRDIWAKVEGSAAYDGNGEMTIIRGNFQDVTERKNREIHWKELNWELSHQRNVLLQAEEIAQLGSWSYWMKEDSYSLSDQVRRIHEIPDEVEVDLKSEITHYYQNYLNELQLLVERVKNGQSYQFDAYITTYMENEKWVRVKGSPLRAPNGRIEGFTGIVQDIDSFKKKEKELQQAKDQLNTQNHILQEAKRMAKIGSWQWNRIDKVLTWSDQLREIFEVPPGFQPNLRYSLNTFYEKDSAEYLKLCIKRAIEKQISYDFQTEIITYKKHRKWIRIKGSPMYDERGSLIGVFGTIQDINDIKEKELQILKTSDLIADQNRRLMDFTQIVSHNLRSHSSNIQTMLNFVKKSESADEQDTYYEYIKETADSLQQAIGHLNEVVKIQKDVSIQKASINIESTLHEVLNILEGDIRLYDINVNFDLKVTELNYVKAYLDSILLNLISNAIKYRHPERSSEISIHTFFDREGNPVLEVQDNGQGIDLNKHGDKVFGMYKTFHKHPEARGIGLFIIKNQVEALKGKIEVESEHGKWTRFRVHF